jgi:predicted DNA-binding protein (UPF0251 family)/DNA-directed RNA polymerase subunit RPC12/RpoP
MGRPHKYQNISSVNPPSDLFLPYGLNEDQIKKIFLTEEELEALKIYHYDNIKNQIIAAQKMNISQATFSRLLTKAYEKLTKALVEGMGIGLISHRGHWGWRWRDVYSINSKPLQNPNQPVNAEQKKQYHGYGCLNCGYEWEYRSDSEHTQKKSCPQCTSPNIYRLIKHY